MYRESFMTIMTQIKLFKANTPKMEEFEAKVNAFLKENKDKIVVKDIKYTGDTPNPHNDAWNIWTVMIIYEVI